MILIRIKIDLYKPKSICISAFLIRIKYDNDKKLLQQTIHTTSNRVCATNSIGIRNTNKLAIGFKNYYPIGFNDSNTHDSRKEQTQQYHRK